LLESILPPPSSARPKFSIARNSHLDLPRPSTAFALSGAFGSSMSLAAMANGGGGILRRKALILKNDPEGNGKYIAGLKEIRVRTREVRSQVPWVHTLLMCYRKLKRSSGQGNELVKFSVRLPTASRAGVMGFSPSRWFAYTMVLPRYVGDFDLEEMLNTLCRIRILLKSHASPLSILLGQSGPKTHLIPEIGSAKLAISTNPSW
jgi:hypothetical protein